MSDQEQRTPVTVTVEATSKRWKKWQLLGLLCFVPGLVLVIIGLVNDNMGLGLSALLVMLIGAVAIIVARIGAWWHHG